jgi:hypothetical protein
MCGSKRELIRRWAYVSSLRLRCRSRETINNNNHGETTTRIISPILDTENDTICPGEGRKERCIVEERWTMDEEVAFHGQRRHVVGLGHFLPSFTVGWRRDETPFHVSSKSD